MTFTNSNSTDKAIAGFIAGFVTTCILHPLDMIKVRFQVNPDKNKTLISTIMKSYNNGPKTLYRGLSANMLGSSTSWAFYLYIYQYSKDMALSRKKREASEITHLSSVDYLLSSSFAGIITVFLTNPIWVVKTRMCTTEATQPNAYKNVFHGLQNTYLHEGVRGLYKGLGPALFGVTHGALQFLVYEQMKIKSSQDTSIPSLILMACLSKIVATSVTYPYQVIKARMQNEVVVNAVDSGIKVNEKSVYRGSFSTMRFIWKGEGLNGFYKGLGANLVRVLPGTCITFAVYEALSKVFQEMS